MHHADKQATNQVDHQDHNASYGITFDKFTGTVHRAIKIGFAGNFIPAGTGLFLRNQTRVKISINRHLFTWHRIQRKTGRHFSDATGTLGHHHKVDDN